jgi:hypothetical protein
VLRISQLASVDSTVKLLTVCRAKTRSTGLELAFLYQGHDRTQGRPPAIPTPDTASPAKIDGKWRFMIRTGRVPGILRRGDKRTASESPRHGRAPLPPIGPAHAPCDGFWHGTGCFRAARVYYPGAHRFHCYRQRSDASVAPLGKAIWVIRRTCLKPKQ